MELFPRAHPGAGKSLAVPEGIIAEENIAKKQRENDVRKRDEVHYPTQESTKGTTEREKKMISKSFFCFFFNFFNFTESQTSPAAPAPEHTPTRAPRLEPAS